MRFLFVLVTVAVFWCSCSSSKDDIAGNLPRDSSASSDTIYDFSQGKYQSTGVITNLAIDGPGFFALRKGTDTVFFRRPAGFIINADGYWVLPNDTAVRLEALPLVTTDGTMSIVSTLEHSTTLLELDSLIDLRFWVSHGSIVFYSKPQATTTIRYRYNLDSDGEGRGSILHTNSFFAEAYANGSDFLYNLYDSRGNSLGVRVGDMLTISISSLVPASVPVRLYVAQFTSLDSLRLAIQQVANQANPGFVSVGIVNGSVTVTSSGAQTIHDLQITSDRPGSSSYVTSALAFPLAISSGASVSTPVLLRPAVATDLISKVMDQSGQNLGLEDGDVITVNGSIGGTPTTPGTLAYSTLTTMNDLCTTVRATFGLPAIDGTLYNSPSVAMDEADTPDDLIPDGAVVIRGQIGEPFALTNVAVTANNSNMNATAPTRFNACAAFTSIQEPRNPGFRNSVMIIYDHRGFTHSLTSLFTHSAIPNEWLWELSVPAPDSIIGGNRGILTFGMDGSPSSFTFTDNTNAFKFKAAGDSILMSIALDVGTAGTFAGLTQFNSPTSDGDSQNGVPLGTLEVLSVRSDGTIDGCFTNGVCRAMFKIPLVRFLNPSELVLKNGYFHASALSGPPVLTILDSTSTSKLLPGALELEP